jgi:hypothetical protein
MKTSVAIGIYNRLIDGDGLARRWNRSRYGSRIGSMIAGMIFVASGRRRNDE